MMMGTDTAAIPKSRSGLRKDISQLLLVNWRTRALVSLGAAGSDEQGPGHKSHGQQRTFGVSHVHASIVMRAVNSKQWRIRNRQPNCPRKANGGRPLHAISRRWVEFGY
jgi:hypothetical protein